MKLYVSGPMSLHAPGVEGGKGDWNFPAFNKASQILARRGYDVENPAEKGIIEGWTWEDYLKLDIKMLLDCDGIALLPDWELSKGARFEVLVAQTVGIPTQLVEEWV